MRRNRLTGWICSGAILAGLLYTSCHSGPPEKDLTHDGTQLTARVREDLQSQLTFLAAHQGRMSVQGKDSPKIQQFPALDAFYRRQGYTPLWSDTGRLTPAADSLLETIARSGNEGLIPASYHWHSLNRVLAPLKTDTEARWDAARWSSVDLLLSDAFLQLVNQLHFGVLPPDSISLKKDQAFPDSVLTALLDSAVEGKHLPEILQDVEPAIPQYHWLKEALQRFQDTHGAHDWGSLPVEYQDTVQFTRLLARRLWQGGWIDSTQLGSETQARRAVRQFQQQHGLYADGVAGARTIAALNRSRQYRLRQIAVNLERWRHLPDRMPGEYLWVNIPSYTLRVWDADTLVLHSRVIVGKPGHETPLLNSHLTNFQLYPYWRVPISIIAREMLPAIRRDTGYLRKHNLEVVDRHNNVVDPRTLDWKRFNSHYFPYVMRQMTGLDNSLGIIKFNFKNDYSVYLHDTNLRNLFQLTHRDLSHGCVRVQQWLPLAMFLIRGDTLRHMPDSVQAWMASQQQKWVPLQERVPIYIRYFTCEADSTGSLTFYPDIYGYDSLMMQKLF